VVLKLKLSVDMLLDEEYEKPYLVDMTLLTVVNVDVEDVKSDERVLLLKVVGERVVEVEPVGDVDVEDVEDNERALLLEVVEERVVEGELVDDVDVEDVEDDERVLLLEVVMTGVYVARKQGQADDIAETVLVGPQLAR
jgi:hypothetical protein